MHRQNRHNPQICYTDTSAAAGYDSRNMRPTRSSGETQSFGEQAARFSLYVPLAVIFIGCLTRGNSDQPGVAMAMFWINVLLIIGGFVLGIVALATVKRYGPERIVGRAIFGIIFNGLALAVLASVLLPMVKTGQMRSELVGHWQMTSPTNNPAVKQMSFTLNKNGTFQMNTVRADETAGVIDGKWVFTTNRIIGFEIQNVTGGDPSLTGQKIGLGKVKSLDARELVITTDKGEERYQRVR
jgi:hypothetical protein